MAHLGVIYSNSYKWAIPYRHPVAFTVSQLIPTRFIGEQYTATSIFPVHKHDRHKRKVVGAHACAKNKRSTARTIRSTGRRGEGSPWVTNCTTHTRTQDMPARPLTRDLQRAQACQQVTKNTPEYSLTAKAT